MKARISIMVVTSENDEYQPSLQRLPPIVDEWEPDTVILLSEVSAPIAPGSLELFDNELTGVSIQNLDDTNFVTATWLNDDATPGACQIPAGRTMVLPWVNGGGATSLEIVADTAICLVDIFIALTTP